MSITVGGVLAAVFFLVPGFLFWYVRNLTTATSKEKQGDLQLSLHSVAITGLLLAFEALILVVVAGIWPAADEALARVLEVGLFDYARERPKLVTTIVLGLPLGNSLLLIVVAWFLPEPKQKEDIWARPLNDGPHLNEPVTDLLKLATVRLKTGELYRGFLAQWEPSPREKRGREFVLWHVSYRLSAADTSWHQLPEGELGSVVLLNTSECNSVELTYIKRPV